MVASETTMRAVVCRGPMKPEAVQAEDAGRPAVADDGVLVRVRASSANPVDLFALSAAGWMLRGRKPVVAGTDFAGTVEAVGAHVTGFRPGDEVFGAARGAFAEYLSVAEDGGVVRKPAAVSFVDAGTLGVAGSTALQALRDHGQVERGQRVLINGASGGVGSFAVQIAKALGAEVTAVCSPRNVDLVRSIGADTVIDYSKDDFARRGERYDLMIDIAGSHSWSDCKRVLTEGGAFVGVGAAALQHGRGGSLRALGHFLWIRVSTAGGGRRAVALFIAKLRKEDLEFLGELAASGRVKPVIERTYDLSHAGDALAYINAGHTQGKLAIAVGG